MSEQANLPDQVGFDASEPRARLIALFGLLTLVVLAGVILGLQAYVDRAREQQVFVKQLEPVSEDLRALRTREDAELNSYGYLDQAQGRVRIPIRRAMELLIAEQRKGGGHER
jgi:hypothetical protein